MTEPRPASPSAAERTAITELVAEAMERFEQDGESALRAFCAGLREHREAVLARLAVLSGIGLLGAAAPPAAPLRVGPYQLEACLGSGGMGVVHRARDATGRLVAVKLVRQDQLQFAGVRERFQREVAVIASLRHDGIVRLLEHGEEQGTPWFAMEFVAGRSLAELLQCFAGRRPADLTGRDAAQALGAPDAAGDLFLGSWRDFAVRLVEQAAQALAAAHAQGVLHRDLKPSNLMVTATGRVVLLDFGLAWARGVDKLTRSGAQLGSIHYMAPEQVRGDAAAIDERSDLYALGVMLRELLSLQCPFQGLNSHGIAQRILAGAPAPLDWAAARIDADTQTVVEKAMAPEPERRYPTAQALQRDLRSLLTGEPVAARRASIGLRVRRLARRHRAAAAAAAVLAGTLLTMPLLVAMHERSLRQALEATNQRLEQEMDRARRNVDLAATAINRTLRTIEAEDLMKVPDLRSFCDSVLQDSGAFVDALIEGNPAEPAARFLLARSLVQAGRLRWWFRDNGRAEALFRRAIELLDTAAGPDDEVDVLQLEARYSLVQLLRSNRRDVASCGPLLAEGLQRAAAHGPPGARSRELVLRYAQALALRGQLRPRDQAAIAIAEHREALRLRREVAEAAQDAILWFEIAKGERQLASSPGLGEVDRAASRRAAAAAVAAGEALIGEDAEALQEVAGLLGAEGAELRRAGDHEAALPLVERSARYWCRAVAARPSRAELRVEAGHASRQVQDCLVALGRRTEAVAQARSAAEEIDAAVRVWPESGRLLQDATQQYLVLAGMLAATPGSAAEAAAAAESAVAYARRLAVVFANRASARHVVALALAARARLHLETDPAAALADAEEASGEQELAVQLGAQQGMPYTIEIETVVLLVRARLRCRQVDAALERLESLGARLPQDLAEQVPELAALAAEPRVAALLAKATAR